MMLQHTVLVCVCVWRKILWCGGGDVCSIWRPTFGQNNPCPHTCTSMVSMLCHSPSHFLSTLYVLPSTHKTAFCNMLRVLAQTNVHLLLGRLGCRSGTLHVCHAVSTTSGGEDYPGVSKDVAGNAWEGRSNVFSWLMYPSAFPQT